MNDLYNEIEEVLDMCSNELKKDRPYPMIPIIINQLNVMKNNVSSGFYEKLQRERESAGFFKIISDNYSFLETDLGKRLVHIIHNYALGK